MGTKIFDKYETVDGIKIHLTENDVQSETLILLFPPGVEDARFIRHFMKSSLFTDNKIVAISYPSRYKSDPLPKGLDNGKIIAFLVSKLLKKITVGYKKVYFVGFSFGTMISTLILQQHWSNGNSEGSKQDCKVIFVNPGEFIPKKVADIFTQLFKNIQNNEAYLELAGQFIRSIKLASPDKFPRERLGNLNLQWLDVLRYEIDLSKQIQFNATFIVATNDFVIKRGSVDKLLQVFPDSKVHVYAGGHIIDYDKDKLLPDILTLLSSYISK